MKVTKRDGSNERRILIGMIVDPGVLARLAPKWDRENFRSKWCNLIGGWCVRFHGKYGRAPGKAIEGLYESWATDSKDKETLALVEQFLGGLSDEFEAQAEASNSQYLIDLAERHFNENRVRRLLETAAGDVDSGDFERAIGRIESFGAVSVAADAEVDLFNDKKATISAFDDSAEESLIKFPGALGEFFGNEFARDRFVAIMAKEKSGKTFMLMELAFRSALQRRRTAFFGMGDMNKKQMTRRFAARAAGRPVRGKLVRYPTSIKKLKGNKTVVVEFDEIEYKSLSGAEAWRAFRKLTMSKVRSEESYLKMLCVPNSSMGIDGVTAKLREWDKHGWTCDTCIIDYADLLAPKVGARDLRDEIDTAWKQMRALSETFHCLVVTATQANAASYDARILTMKHFANDKRKLAHVNALIGLNQTTGEKNMDVMRLNMILRREDENNPFRVVHVAGCRSIANPCVRSTW